MNTYLEPAVSVVMPMGSVDDFVGEQLAALDHVAASFPFEIIISLNSPDPSERERLARLVATMERPVRVVDSSDRRGASHARNVGAAAALAPVLAFCDSDDIVRPDWLERLVAGLHGYEAVGGHLEEFAASRWVAGIRPPATPGELPTYLGVPYLVSANFAIERTWYERVGGFDETLHRCEDIALGWDLINAGARLGFVPDAVVDYRTRDGVWSLLKQHYHYGRGMTEVLVRRNVPKVNGASPAGLFAANRQSGGKGSMVRWVRRGFIAVGRAHGLLTERTRRAADHKAVGNDRTDLRRTTVFDMDFVNAPTIDAIVTDLLDRPAVSAGKVSAVVTPNVDHLVGFATDTPTDVTEYCRTAMWILPDGQPLVWASRLVGKPLDARLPGSTLVHELMPRIKAGDRSVFVVAPNDDVATLVGDDLGPSRCLVAPMLDLEQRTRFIDFAQRVAASAAAVQAEFVFLGLAHPKAPVLTEHLLTSWPKDQPQPVVLCVGAAFEMHYGRVKRAPEWAQRMGIEWLYRFVQEPRRLFHRYFVRGPRFAGLVLRELGRA